MITVECEGHSCKEARYTKEDTNVPSNVYLLNVAFYSFALFALGQMLIAIWVAHSQAMFADSSAMMVDSLTYLFNSYAERVKNKSLSNIDNDNLSNSEKEMRRLSRTKQRLWLEIIPPLCSVLTLAGLTIFIMIDSFTALAEPNDELVGEEASVSQNDPNVGIMFLFSALNLGVDLLNATCFARANHAFGFAVIDKDRHRYMLAYDGSLHNELADSLRGQSIIDLSHLDEEKNNFNDVQNRSVLLAGNTESTPLQRKNWRDMNREMNLNMCSAYTHVFADTLRSTAVLIAAGISYMFEVGAPTVVDSIASLAVSAIILMSLLPLVRGILHACDQLRQLSTLAGRLTQ